MYYKFYIYISYGLLKCTHTVIQLNETSIPMFKYYLLNSQIKTEEKRWRGSKQKNSSNQIIWYYSECLKRHILSHQFLGFPFVINIFSTLYFIFLFMKKICELRMDSKVIFNTASMVWNASMHAIEFLIVMWDYNCDSCVSNSKLEWFYFWIILVVLFVLFYKIITFINRLPLIDFVHFFIVIYYHCF